MRRVPHPELEIVRGKEEGKSTDPCDVARGFGVGDPSQAVTALVRLCSVSPLAFEVASTG